MRCMRCKCRMDPLHLSAPPRKVPSIVIIWSEWIQSVLLYVNECCSIALTGELYSNVPLGLGGSDGAGDVCCSFSGIWDVEYLSRRLLFLKEEHFKSQIPTTFMLHVCLILPVSQKLNHAGVLFITRSLLFHWDLYFFHHLHSYLNLCTPYCHWCEVVAMQSLGITPLSYV